MCAIRFVSVGLWHFEARIFVVSIRHGHNRFLDVTPKLFETGQLCVSFWDGQVGIRVVGSRIHPFRIFFVIALLGSTRLVAVSIWFMPLRFFNVGC